MRKTITKKWLDEKNACYLGVKWFVEQKDKTTLGIIKTLKKVKKYDWLNWLMVRVMKYKQYVRYAVYAANQVIDIYEKNHPDDDRPRNAIQAAKKCIKEPNSKNKVAAADAAAAAANANAADAADANAYAAAAAADAAAAAAANAYAAADAYAAAYAVERGKMSLKIINYGIRLLRQEK